MPGVLLARLIQDHIPSWSQTNNIKETTFKPLISQHNVMYELHSQDNLP